MYIFRSHSSYIQGRNIINCAGGYLAKYGTQAMIIADATAMNIVIQSLRESLSKNGLDLFFEEFQGECTHTEINRLSKRGEKVNANIVVGAGGGKALDTAKAISTKLSISMASLPTIASNDSPTSCVSVIHSDSGEVEEILVNKTHPDLVLVDSGVIAKAPTRFFIAGMGDALATKFEAMACYRAKGETKWGGAPTQAALAIAKQCYHNLQKYGSLARRAVEKNLVTRQTEIIIETNILLSGIGFENGGLAFAHALHNGLTHIEDAHQALHGEKVAFGTIVQLIIEGGETEEVQDFVRFCSSLGLPITLEDLGVKNPDKAEFTDISEIICREEKRKIQNEPVEVTPTMICDAIFLADEIGHKFKRNKFNSTFDGGD